MPDRTLIEQRLAVLRDYLIVARGRLAAAQDAVADEQAGVHQIEGRILEVEDILQAEAVTATPPHNVGVKWHANESTAATATIKEPEPAPPVVTPLKKPKKGPS